MITLNGQTVGPQTFVATLQQAKAWLTLPITNYLFKVTNMTSKEIYFFIADVTADNLRYTEVSFEFATDDPTAGKVKITERGLFYYKVFGQNSATNLDPLDATVAGEVNRGTMRITGQTAATFPAITIPDNIIYYE
tara:strand:+ start:285 stop:692 length:408 start_codon:yes stop_codon:yes gene_type:complete